LGRLRGKASDPLQNHSDQHAGIVVDIQHFDRSIIRTSKIVTQLFPFFASVKLSSPGSVSSWFQSLREELAISFPPVVEIFFFVKIGIVNLQLFFNERIHSIQPILALLK
jgi:hypothetical protein